MTDRALNSTCGALLALLQRGPMTGWELLTEGQALIGDFWTLTRSQVYRELAGMHASGLISAGETGPRDRQPYSITPAGEAAFRDWIMREPGHEQIRYPLLLTLAFGDHLPPELLAQFIAHHREDHVRRLADYVERREQFGRELSVYDAATLDFGIRYETAVLEWFDHLPKRISRPRRKARA